MGGSDQTLKGYAPPPWEIIPLGRWFEDMHENYVEIARGSGACRVGSVFPPGENWICINRMNEGPDIGRERTHKNELLQGPRGLESLVAGGITPKAG